MQRSASVSKQKRTYRKLGFRRIGCSFPPCSSAVKENLQAMPQKTGRNLKNRNLTWAYRAVGAATAIGMMEMLADVAGQPLVRVPFVTSIVLVMALPDSEAATPRAIVGGHLISSGCGIFCSWILGPGEASSAVAVGAATFFMIASGAVHPPAGIDAFLVPVYELPTSWLINPVLLGSLLLAAFGELWRFGERVLIGRHKR
jgi:CBS-domain-containing membrane protein